MKLRITLLNIFGSMSYTRIIFVLLGAIFALAINVIPVGETYVEIAHPKEVKNEEENIIPIGKMVVTGYSKIETCPNRICTTASGKVASIGMIACPRKMKFGTVLLIDGSKYTCEDRTALRFDGRIDIYFGDTEESYYNALKFGKQLKEIYLYESVESL